MTNRNSRLRALAGAAFSTLSVLLTPFSANSQTWAPTNGNVQLADGTPLCAMVLANGQYMFSCDGGGAFDLGVPLDENRQIKLFSFADGFSPFSAILNPNNFPFTVFMETALPDSPLISLSRDAECSGTNRVRISGSVESASRQPLCAMVLANGQHMFSCGASQGRYDLDVPVDQNEQVTIFGFADGFQPYSETFRAPECDFRYAVINGVELRYQLADPYEYQLPETVNLPEGYCSVLLEAINTTSQQRAGNIWWNFYEAPGVLLGTHFASFYLPPNTRDTTLATGAEICDDIFSWELNSDLTTVF